MRGFGNCCEMAKPKARFKERTKNQERAKFTPLIQKHNVLQFCKKGKLCKF